MKRLSIGLVLLLALVAPARAQLQGGSISGTVADEQGAILPGVTITLRGVDATQEVTTEGNGQFRFLNLAPGFYTLSASLQGFTTLVREQVQVVVGRNVDLLFALKLASVAETITVTGESPLVDTRATGTATNFTSEELTKIPTSRDPFALMRAVPGVLVDRVNIGGNETGQQSNFVSKGTRPQDAVWTLDGMNITDMAATGASPTYFNYDNFEEVQVATAGQSIKQPTGGIGLNMIVKRGTNQFSGVRAATSTTIHWNPATCPTSSSRPVSLPRRPTTTIRSPTTATTSAVRSSAIAHGSITPTRFRTSDSSAAPARWSIARS